MSGRDAFLAMQTINPKVKAVILSAYGVEAEIQAVLDAGAAGFIRKPFRAEELARELAALLAPDSPAP